jgi:Zn-finger protein
LTLDPQDESHFANLNLYIHHKSTQILHQREFTKVVFPNTSVLYIPTDFRKGLILLLTFIDCVFCFLPYLFFSKFSSAKEHRWLPLP